MNEQVSWVREYTRISVPTFLDVGVATIAGLLSSIVLLATSGASATGSVRAAQTIFAPMSVLYIGAYPALVKFLAASNQRLRACVLGSAALVGLNLLAGGAALLVPDSVGSTVFGKSWADISSVLLPVTVLAAVSALSAGPTVALRSLGEAKSVLLWRLVVAPVGLIASGVGSMAFGVAGFCAGGCLAAVVMFLGLVVAMRRADRGSRHSDVLDHVADNHTDLLGLPRER